MVTYDECFEKYGLRDYQKESCLELISKYSDKNANIPLLLVLPTGTGKTRTAMALCCEMLSNSLCDEIMWVANRHFLLSQAESTRDLSIYLMAGKSRKDYEDAQKEGASFEQKLRELDKNGIRNKFTFVMNTSFYKREIKNVSEKTLVVYDEAHHCIAKSFCLEDVKNKNAKVLGLTATPFRCSDDEEPFVRSYVRKDESESRTVISEKVKKALVEKFEYEKRENYICRDERGRYEGIREGEDYWEWFRDFIKNQVLGRDYRNPESKVLIYADSEAAQKAYEVLKESSQKVGLVLGDTAMHYNKGAISRNELLECYDFDSNEKNAVEVLINNQVLVEGFDQPKITDIVLLRDTTSPILMTQMIGRGLRKCDEFNKECCYVYPVQSPDYESRTYSGRLEDKYSEYRTGNIQYLLSAYSNTKKLAYGSYFNLAWYSLLMYLLEKDTGATEDISGVLMENGDPAIYVTPSGEKELCEYAKERIVQGNYDCKLAYYFEASNTFQWDRYRSEYEKDNELGFITFLEDYGLYNKIDAGNSKLDEEKALNDAKKHITRMVEMLKNNKNLSIDDVIKNELGEESDCIERRFYQIEVIKGLVDKYVSVCDVTTGYDDTISDLVNQRAVIVETITNMFKNIDHPMKFFLRIKSDDSYEELWNERKEELFDEAKIIELIKANDVDFHKNEGRHHYWQPNKNNKQLFNDRYKGGKELFVKWTAGKYDYCTDDFDAFCSLEANIINGHFYQCREYKELCSRFDESLLKKHVFNKIRWKKGEKQPTELWNALVDYSYSRNSEDVLRKYAEAATDSMIKALEKCRENEIEGRYMEYTGTFYNRLAKLANSPKGYDVFSEISSCINLIDTMNKTIDDVGGIRSEDKEKIKNYLCNRRLNFRPNL